MKGYEVTNQLALYLLKVGRVGSSGMLPVIYQGRRGFRDLGFVSRDWSMAKKQIMMRLSANGLYVKNGREDGNKVEAILKSSFRGHQAYVCIGDERPEDVIKAEELALD